MPQERTIERVATTHCSRLINSATVQFPLNRDRGTYMNVNVTMPREQENTGGTCSFSVHECSWQWRSSTIALTLFVLLTTVFLLLLYVGRIFDRSNMEYGEGPITSFVERLRMEPVSREWLDKAPYTFTAYGPSYYSGITGDSYRLFDWGLVPRSFFDWM